VLADALAAQTVKVGLINSYTGFVAQPADKARKASISTSRSTRKICRRRQIELLRP